jgi:hypothetical protein
VLGDVFVQGGGSTLLCSFNNSNNSNKQHNEIRDETGRVRSSACLG